MSKRKHHGGEEEQPGIPSFSCNVVSASYYTDLKQVSTTVPRQKKRRGRRQLQSVDDDDLLAMMDPAVRRKQFNESTQQKLFVDCTEEVTVEKEYKEEKENKEEKKEAQPVCPSEPIPDPPVHVRAKRKNAMSILMAGHKKPKNHEKPKTNPKPNNVNPNSKAKPKAKVKAKAKTADTGNHQTTITKQGQANKRSLLQEKEEEGDSSGDEARQLRERDKRTFDYSVFRLPSDWKNPDLPKLRPTLPFTPDEKGTQVFVEAVVFEFNFSCLFGVTPEGNSIAIRIHEFETWFYLLIPETWSAENQMLLDTHLAENKIQYRCVEEKRRNLMGWTNLAQRCVLKLFFPSLSQRFKCKKFFQERRRLNGITISQSTDQSVIITLPETWTYFCILTKTKKLDRERLQLLKTKVKELGIKCSYTSQVQALTFKLIFPSPPEKQKFDEFLEELKFFNTINTAHQNEAPELQFEIASQIRLKQWVSVSHLQQARKRETRCQLECLTTDDTKWTRDDLNLVTPPCLYCAFDIETISPFFIQPKAKRQYDSVVTISLRLQRHGSKVPEARIVLSLGAMNPIPGVIVYSVSTERQLLEAFFNIVVEWNDVDVILGHNSIDYDLPYLMRRAKILKYNDFIKFSRWKNYVCPRKKEKKDPDSKQFAGKKGDIRFYVVPGRIQLDTLLFAQSMYDRPEDNKLKTLIEYHVAEKPKGKAWERPVPDTEWIANGLIHAGIALGTEQKETDMFQEIDSYLSITLDPQGNKVQSKIDLPYTHIRPYWQRDQRYRTAVGVYCMNDTDACWLLALKINMAVENMCMSNLTFTSSEGLLTKGQGLKTMNLVYFYAETRNWVITRDVLRQFKFKDGYKGGHNEEAQTGYYEEGVLVLDFSSLYPSIIIGFLLCLSTIVCKKEWDHLTETLNDTTKWTDLVQQLAKSLTEVDIEKLGKFQFVKESVQDTLYPYMLQDLLSARSKTKKAMDAAKEAGRMDEAETLNGRQLAIKQTGNSIYGANGVKEGQLSFVPLAGAVTELGRKMFEMTKGETETNFGGKVIYGDTDSLFIVFPKLNPERKMIEDERVLQQWKLGQQISAHMKTLLPSACSLTVEKVFKRLLLTRQKGYVGQMATVEKGKVVTVNKLKVTGLEAVRRDWCPFTRMVISGFFEMAIAENDVKKAIEFVKKQLQRLKEGKVSYKEMSIGKSFKGMDGYKAKGGDRLPQMQVARKLEKRGILLEKGERFQYVILLDLPPGTELPMSKKNTRTLTNEVDSLHEFYSFRAETVDYAEKKKLKLDLLWYLDKQIIGPLQERSVSWITDELDKTFADVRAYVYRQQQKSTGIANYFQPRIRRNADL